MKRLLGLSPFILSGALVALAAEASLAATATITGVQLNPTAEGVEIVLDTDGGDLADVFTVSQGNTFRADITSTRLQLADGSSYRQDNPAPGIAAITLAPLDANSVRLIVEGDGQVPVGGFNTGSGNSLVLALQAGSQPSPPSSLPANLETVPGNGPDIAQVQPEAASPEEAAPAEEMPRPVRSDPAVDILVPEPDVTIDGVVVPRPARQIAPPFLPRAVPPPVGDIAYAETAILSSSIDLGSNERIPRLVLRNAPAREVLSLLARAAGLNLVFTAVGDDGAAAGGEDGPAITLDIENESVQDVFNHVLRVSDLKANRVGRSIYVGPVLPDGARNIVSRTLRLNQVGPSAAAGFLASLGAEATQVVNTTEIETVTIEGSTENAPAINRVLETESTTIEQLTYDPEDGTNVAQPLTGLQVITDERLNSITLVGEAEAVELATRYALRLDLRRRQVAINVRIIDVDLNASSSVGVNWSFLSNGTFRVDQNLGDPTGGVGLAIIGGNPLDGLSAQITAAINNNNAKILTDPTLVVQEGQSASVALVENVLTSLQTQVNPETGAVTSITPVFEEAGLQLQINVETIDDNGFVTFNVSPQVSAPQAPITFNSGFGGAQTLTPLQIREVSTGSIRIRDGQTLVVAGIIQDSDATSVTKVPILGDLPILGALFRSTTETNQRNEVIVLLTPDILDDSDESVFGYSYVPAEEIQEAIDQYR
ncbi:type II secretory pathway, component HofQ [filamentous cyanobacterium CCP5]|nr:type II secretory pathway, component HofQ [filamentous cyanobacterium CCP5]